MPRYPCALKLPANSTIPQALFLSANPFINACHWEISLFCPVLYIHSDFFVLVFRVTQITLISCYFKEIKI